MNVVIKVIKQAIESRTKRVAKIREILKACPVAEILELRQQAQVLLVEANGDYPKIADQIEQLAKQEKKQLVLAKKQQGSKLWDDDCRISMEIDDLTRELYYAERRFSQ